MPNSDTIATILTGLLGITALITVVFLVLVGVDWLVTSAGARYELETGEYLDCTVIDGGEFRCTVTH